MLLDKTNTQKSGLIVSSKLNGDRCIYGIVKLNCNLLCSRSWHTKYLNRNSVGSRFVAQTQNS